MKRYPIFLRIKKHSLALLLLAPIGFLYGQDFKAYDQTIGNLPISIKMVAIPAGKFKMGSPDSDKNHQPDEGPQTNVEIGAFWMAATETTHDQFSAFRFEDKDADPLPDAISRPTAQYIDLTWGMGKEGGYPANSMQPFTAIAYCRWLYRKTGVFFRLPTEAEWEYACKANSDTQMPKGIIGGLPSHIYGLFVAFAFFFSIKTQTSAGIIGIGSSK